MKTEKASWTESRNFSSKEEKAVKRVLRDPLFLRLDGAEGDLYNIPVY